jgi:hypothetical protein
MVDPAILDGSDALPDRAAQERELEPPAIPPTP